MERTRRRMRAFGRGEPQPGEVYAVMGYDHDGRLVEPWLIGKTVSHLDREMPVQRS